MSTNPPTLRTKRFLLRPLRLDDASAIHDLAGDHAVASTTRSIPHPYEMGMAESFISTQSAEFQAGKSATFAICHGKTGDLQGCIGLIFSPQDESAELGYWIGKPFWGNGYATEASIEVIRYGFETRNMNRIYGCHMQRNPASGRVLEKVGMKKEGFGRQAIKKFGRFEDVCYYAILSSEFHHSSS